MPQTSGARSPSVRTHTCKSQITGVHSRDMQRDKKEVTRRQWWEEGRGFSFSDIVILDSWLLERGEAQASLF